MTEGLVFTVRYQRKIQTVPYENLTIGLEMEFHRYIMNGNKIIGTKRKEAFNIVREQVEKWIDESLNGERR